MLVQNGWGAAGLAKTLRLEAPQVRTTIVHTPPIAQAVDWVVAEGAGFFDLGGQFLNPRA